MEGFAAGEAPPKDVAGKVLTHPLRGRVIPIALAVLEAQVLAADAAEARLLSPFPELVPLYEARGYQRVADRPDLDYLRKQRTAP